VANDDGTWVFDDDTGWDVSLELTGNFSDKERIIYAEAIAAALNKAEIPVSE
jgi:hypothetical protein